MTASLSANLVTLRIQPAAGVRVFLPGKGNAAVTGTALQSRPGFVQSIIVETPDTSGLDVIELHDLAIVDTTNLPTILTAAKEIIRPSGVLGQSSYTIPVQANFYSGIVVICRNLAVADVAIVYKSRGPTGRDSFVQRL